MKRALIKTITYRVLGSFTGILITYALTNNFVLGVSIGSADLIIKPIVYYLHEMMWEGKKNNEMPF